MHNVKCTLSVLITISLALAVLVSSGCSEVPSPPWPTDYSTVFTKIISDPTNDLVPFMPLSPPYPVSYPLVDVTQISLGIQGTRARSPAADPQPRWLR